MLRCHVHSTWATQLCCGAVPQAVWKPAPPVWFINKRAPKKLFNDYKFYALAAAITALHLAPIYS